eukprot:scaffold3546_cov135-Skeletonema_marinoi.AAC.1
MVYCSRDGSTREVQRLSPKVSSSVPKATAIFNRVRKGIHFLRDCEKVSYSGWVLTKKMDILESLKNHRRGKKKSLIEDEMMI